MAMFFIVIVCRAIVVFRQGDSVACISPSRATKNKRIALEAWISGSACELGRVGLLWQLLFFFVSANIAVRLSIPFSKKISLLRLHGFIFVVCEADIIFVFRFLVFIIVVPDIKHLPCQKKKFFVIQRLMENDRKLGARLGRDSLPYAPSKCYALPAGGNNLHRAGR